MRLAAYFAALMLLAVPGACEARSPVLVLGALSEKARSGDVQSLLDRVLRNLELAPTGRRLLDEWESGRSTSAIVVDFVAFGDKGQAGDGKVTVSDAVENPVELAGVLAHEWLGHMLMERQLTRMTGERLSGYQNELLARARGWRVQLELYPGSLDRDEEFSAFVRLGPAAYLERLRQPHRPYGLELGLDEMRAAGTVLVKRAARFKAWRSENEDICTSDPAMLADKERFVDCLHRVSLVDTNIKLAQRLNENKKVLAKWRRTALNPDVQRAVSSWTTEVRDICDWARETTQRSGRCP